MAQHIRDLLLVRRKLRINQNTFPGTEFVEILPWAAWACPQEEHRVSVGSWHRLARMTEEEAARLGIILQKLWIADTVGRRLSGLSLDLARGEKNTQQGRHSMTHARQD